MSVSPNQTDAVVTSPRDALAVLHKKLVAIHYGLAEHGPTDPKMIIPWALDELQEATRYIRSVEQANQPTATTEDHLPTP